MPLKAAQNFRNAALFRAFRCAPSSLVVLTGVNFGELISGPNDDPGLLVPPLLANVGDLKLGDGDPERTAAPPDCEAEVRNEGDKGADNVCDADEAEEALAVEAKIAAEEWPQVVGADDAVEDDSHSERPRISPSSW